MIDPRCRFVTNMHFDHRRLFRQILTKLILMFVSNVRRQSFCGLMFIYTPKILEMLLNMDENSILILLLTR